jgi:hypothetical protein
VPPLVGVAVNVTLVPEHIVVALALETTLGVTDAFTVIVLELDVPFPHAFVGVTEIAPPAVPKVTVILFVFEPKVIVAPAGNTQVYPVAPLTLVIEYVLPVDEAQADVDPEMAPDLLLLPMQFSHPLHHHHHHHSPPLQNLLID